MTDTPRSSPVSAAALARARAVRAKLCHDTECVHDDGCGCLDVITEAIAPVWQPIETAPKDGTRVDLFFPGVRGRTINSFWHEGSIHPEGGWFWLSPKWGEGGELLPERDWFLHCYPSMSPTHWMPIPEPPK